MGRDAQTEHIFTPVKIINFGGFEKQTLDKNGGLTIIYILKAAEDTYMSNG